MFLSVNICVLLHFNTCCSRFRVFMKRFMMCESRELTSNPPFGVTRLAEAPLVLCNHAVDTHLQVNIIRSRYTIYNVYRYTIRLYTMLPHKRRCSLSSCPLFLVWLHYTLRGSPAKSCYGYLVTL